MAADRSNDGRIGKQIDWSLVISSITRPVEPPALEVLDYFEEEEGSKFSFNLRDEVETIWAEIPDPDLRLRYLDAVCEIAPLLMYIGWTKQT